MNDIIRPLTPDKMVGWDEYNQLWAWKCEGKDRIGRIIADVRGKICPICAHGWAVTADSLTDQYFWDDRVEYAHQSCFIRLSALNEHTFWLDALVDAGFIFGPVDNPERFGEGGPSLQALPNEYWGPKDPWGAGKPWYRVRLLKKQEDGYTNTAHGRTLKVGSRKRVFQLSVEDGEGSYDYDLAQKRFASEDVTKEITRRGLMVHAWGRDKAKEYLKHLADILGVTEMRRKAAEALAPYGK